MFVPMSSLSSLSSLSSKSRSLSLRFLIAVLGCLAAQQVFSSAARAEVVAYDNLPVTANIPGVRFQDKNSDKKDNILRVAQGFSITNGGGDTLLRVDLSLFRGSTDNGASFSVDLYRSEGGLPGRRILELAEDISVNRLSQSARPNDYDTGGLGLYTIRDINFHLDRGDYFVVVTADDANKLGWATGPKALGGSFVSYEDSGSRWSANSIGSGSMGMRVTAAPEPGTLALGALAALGGAGGWWMRRKKRQAEKPEAESLDSSSAIC